MQREEWLKTDLKQPIRVVELQTELFLNDEKGNLIGVEVYSNGASTTVSGTIICYMIRPDSTTIKFNGTISGNKVSVVLPKEAYYYSGRANFVIKAESNGNKITLCAFSALVYRDSTDRVVDDERIIPSLDEIMSIVEQIDDMTVSATTLSPGESATVALSSRDNHYHLAFGIPKGRAGSEPNTFKLTALAANWDASDPPTQDIAVSGLTVNDVVIVGMGEGISKEQFDAMKKAELACTKLGTNSVTISCFGTVPTIDLPITLMNFS